MILFRDIMSGRLFHDVYLYIYDEYYTIFITNINKKDIILIIFPYKMCWSSESPGAKSNLDICAYEDFQ